MHAAHHQFEIGREPLLADNVDGAVIADLPGGQGGDDTRAVGAEAEDELFAEIFRADRIGRGQKRLIDAHGGSAGQGRILGAAGRTDQLEGAGRSWRREGVRSLADCEEKA